MRSVLVTDHCNFIKTCRREDEFQRRAVDFSARIRSHQETRARDELQWQKNLLIEEVSKQETQVCSFGCIEGTVVI